MAAPVVRSQGSLAGKRYCRGNGYARVSLTSRRELVRSSEQTPKTQPITVYVTPTFFRVEITDSRGLLATWGARRVADPRDTIPDPAR